MGPRTGELDDLKLLAYGAALAARRRCCWHGERSGLAHDCCSLTCAVQNDTVLASTQVENHRTFGYERRRPTHPCLRCEGYCWRSPVEEILDLTLLQAPHLLIGEVDRVRGG